MRPKNDFAGGSDHFVDGVGPNLGGLDGVGIANDIKRATDEKRETDFDVGVAGLERIAGKLLEHETIERFVVVEATE